MSTSFSGPTRMDVSPLGTGKNWVTKTEPLDGLGPYIRGIAHALIRNGHSESSAIAIAVGTVKRWAAGGGHVNPKTRAKAAEAVAHWEAMKAKNAVKTVAKGGRADLSLDIRASGAFAAGHSFYGNQWTSGANAPVTAQTAGQQLGGLNPAQVYLLASAYQTAMGQKVTGTFTESQLDAVKQGLGAAGAAKAAASMKKAQAAFKAAQAKIQAALAKQQAAALHNANVAKAAATPVSAGSLNQATTMNGLSPQDRQALAKSQTLPPAGFSWAGTPSNPTLVPATPAAQAQIDLINKGLAKTAAAKAGQTKAQATKAAQATSAGQIALQQSANVASQTAASAQKPTTATQNQANSINRLSGAARVKAAKGKPPAGFMWDTSNPAAPVLVLAKRSDGELVRPKGECRVAGLNPGDGITLGIVTGVEEALGRVWVSVEDQRGEVTVHDYDPTDIVTRNWDEWDAHRKCDHCHQRPPEWQVQTGLHGPVRQLCNHCKGHLYEDTWPKDEDIAKHNLDGIPDGPTSIKRADGTILYVRAFGAWAKGHAFHGNQHTGGIKSTNMGPNAWLEEGATKYSKAHRIVRPGTIKFGSIKVDTPTAKRIADAYEAAPSHDPKAEAAYRQMAKEVDAQYDYLTKKMGVKVSVVKEDPYPNVEAMQHDLVHNHHIAVLATATTGHHPFFTDEQNDHFRAVHDAFGHAATGRGFDRHGEEAAWLSHSLMFSPKARDAMTTETRGQNAVLTQRRKGFAEQKIALLPKEFSSIPEHDLRADDTDHPEDYPRHCVAGRAWLDRAGHMAKRSIGEFGPSGPGAAASYNTPDASGAGYLLPNGPRMKRHRFSGDDLKTCDECGQPVQAACHIKARSGTRSIGPSSEVTDSMKAQGIADQDSLIPGIEATMKAFFAKQRKATLARLTGKRGKQMLKRAGSSPNTPEGPPPPATVSVGAGAAATTPPPLDPSAIFDDAFWSAQLATLLTEHYKVAAQTAVNTVNKQANVTLNPGETSALYGIDDILTQRAQDQGWYVNQDTKNDIFNTLSAGIQNGEGIPDLAKRVEEVFDEADRKRAILIARTEAVGSLNQAASAYLQALPDDVANRKIWLAHHDDRTRPTHRLADGQIQHKGDPFIVGGSPMMEPGDKAAPIGEWINCRCVLGALPPGVTTDHMVNSLEGLIPDTSMAHLKAIHAEQKAKYAGAGKK